MSRHRHQHIERFDAHSGSLHGASSRLNLLDICQDNPRRNKGDSLAAVGKRALERELIEQARPYADQAVSGLVDAMKQLDKRGTRALEERTGKTPLTELLDKTRHERYRMFKLVAQEALNVAEHVVEEDIK